MRRGMAVAAHNHRARPCQTQFRPDHMHDAAMGAVPSRKPDIVFAAILLQHRDLIAALPGSHRGRSPCASGRQRGRGMIECRERAIRTARLHAAFRQRRERLRRRHLMDEMQVDVEHSRAIVAFGFDDMRIPGPSRTANLGCFEDMLLLRCLDRLQPAMVAPGRTIRETGPAGAW